MKYSIIIPHKNTADLLQRCLDSIPEKESIQVIVVDDNSDPSVVDFDNFPGKSRSNVEVVLTKEGRGAGYARNIGIEHAKGKWLLFMDSDDLFSQDLESVLSEIEDASQDVIYTPIRFVDSDDITKEIRRSGSETVREHFEAFLSGKDNGDKLKYDFPALWGKIIRASIVKENDVKFDETRWANDIYFSSQVSCLCNDILILNRNIYIATRRQGSLTYNFLSSEAEITTRLTEAIKSEELIRKHSNFIPYHTINILQSLYQKYGTTGYLKFMFKHISNSAIFSNMASYYLKSRIEAIKRIFKK